MKKSFQKQLQKKPLKFEFEFQIFVKRKLQVTGFQELCLLCYETPWLRRSKAERVAQFVLFRLL